MKAAEMACPIAIPLVESIVGQTGTFLVAREQQSLRALTVQSIRRAILSLHFQPGERLTERALCAMTGVSRSLMREALRDLEAEALIVNVLHRGPVVATVTAKDANEIYEVRKALEPLTARLFVKNASAADIAALKRAAAACKAAMQADDIYGSVDALESLYRTLYDGAGNTLALALGRMIYAKAGLLRAVTFRHQSEQETRESIRRIDEIAKALAKRDDTAAVEACLKQIERSARVAARLLKA
jgi:DNA-binding GntR family transcriptional regulator